MVNGVNSMGDNIIVKIYRYLHDMLVYKPSRTPPTFFLKELPNEDETLPITPASALQGSAEELNMLLRQAKSLQDSMEKITETLRDGKISSIDEFRDEYKKLSQLQTEISPARLAYDAVSTPNERQVSVNLEENRSIVEKLYRLPENKDAVIRHLTIPLSPPVRAMMVFLEGMVDSKTLNLAILQPLMLFSADRAVNNTADSLTDQIIEECLPANQVKKAADFQSVQNSINSGDTALFINGVPEAVLIDTKGMAQRSVGRPVTEQTIRGSQAAFSEGLRINTGLIRSTLKSSDLVTEFVTVGKRTNTNCAIMYLASVANPSLVKEIKRRIEGISTSYVGDIGTLQQFIEDHPGILFPQALSTERPDRVASHLSEGRVAFILEGVPFAHIVPVSFFTFFHSAEDFSFKGPNSSFLRILRLIAGFITLLLPSFYLAIYYFHPEALPTEIVLAIAGARERVPFPALVEVILMEFSFELIREGGLRIPGVLGSTIGIVGALILGQAAVTANIVSPIVVIIIALTGLASFAIPDFQMAMAFRMLRFVMLLLAATLGLVGVASGLLIMVLLLCSMKSFGVPYMVPVAPKAKANLDVVIRGPVFRQEQRPDALNTIDRRRQPHISRKWMMEKPAGEEDKS